MVALSDTSRCSARRYAVCTPAAFSPPAWPGAVSCHRSLGAARYADFLCNTRRQSAHAKGFPEPTSTAASTSGSCCSRSSNFVTALTLSAYPGATRATNRPVACSTVHRTAVAWSMDGSAVTIRIHGCVPRMRASIRAISGSTKERAQMQTSQFASTCSDSTLTTAFKEQTSWSAALRRKLNSRRLA